MWTVIDPSKTWRFNDAPDDRMAAPRFQIETEPSDCNRACDHRRQFSRLLGTSLTDPSRLVHCYRKWRGPDRLPQEETHAHEGRTYDLDSRTAAGIGSGQRAPRSERAD